MKKVCMIVFIILISLSLSAKITLFLKLDKVAKEPKAKTELKSDDGRTFSDETIAIAWEPLADGFNFTLTNKAKTALTVTWDECAFVDAEGSSFRVIHGTAGKILTVEAGAKSGDVIAPSDYLNHGKKGWALTPIFQEKWSAAEFKNVSGKDIVYKVVLPVKKDKAKIVYTFFFKAFAK